MRRVHSVHSQKVFKVKKIPLLRQLTLHSQIRGLNTEVALRRAKENVEKHYAVVGVLEELNKTLTVLEHYIPRYFKGAKDVYWSK